MNIVRNMYDKKFNSLGSRNLKVQVIGPKYNQTCKIVILTLTAISNIKLLAKILKY